MTKLCTLVHIIGFDRTLDSLELKLYMLTFLSNSRLTSVLTRLFDDLGMQFQTLIYRIDFCFWLPSWDATVS